MKTKIINLLVAAILLGVMVSCGNITTAARDKEMLQKFYDVVYPINKERYITIDSLGKIYDIRVNFKGEIVSTVEIR